MPTGWRPKDVETLYPVSSIRDVYHFEKYDTHLSGKLMVWSWIQIIILLVLVMDLFLRFGDIGIPQVMYYGAFVFVSIFCLTALMDRATYALPADAVRFLLLNIIFFSQGKDWFGLTSVSPMLSFAVYGYGVLALFLSAYFYFSENRPYRLAHA